MRYIEVTVNTPGAEIDARCQEMADMGAGGFVIENEEDFKDFLEQNHQYWDYVDDELENQFAGVSRIKCYLTDDEDGLAVLRRINAAYDDVTTSYVEDSDWENNWREYYKPIDVGEKLVVVPEWEEAPQDVRLPLRLDPGLIFGTGSHATTRMCLAALEEFSKPGVRVLDLGCGSGILGIGALILGCDSCLGVDIDPKAPDVVMSNAALNGIGADKMTAWAGDIIADSTSSCLRTSLPTLSFLSPPLCVSSWLRAQCSSAPALSSTAGLKPRPRLSPTALKFSITSPKKSGTASSAADSYIEHAKHP